MSKIKKPEPSEINNQVIADIRSGISSAFWLAITEAIRNNISALDIDLHENYNNLSPDGIKDMLRVRELLNNLLETPERIINSIELGEKQPRILDPYARTFKELREDNNV